MTISISFAGDLFISETIQNDILIDEGINKIFSKADLSIVNLEAPIVSTSTASQRIQKDGPHLKMGDRVLSFIKNCGINTVCLANNHIMDYGPEGLSTTIDSCKLHGLKYVGAGGNSSIAAEPLIYDAKGKKIGLIAVCENEWSVATNTSPGANGFDLVDCYSSIVRLRSKCAVVIVIVHGGNEHYNLPSPRIKKTMRFLIDAGADAVVMHHTHCVSGMEVYNGHPIFYGLGNFVFTSQGRTEGWYQGLVVELIVAENGNISWNTKFVDVATNGSLVRLAPPQLKNKLINSFEQLSKIISNDTMLIEEWINFIEKSSPFYYQVMSVINLLPTAKLRGLARRLGLAKHVLPRRHLTHLINYITCESHLDVSRAVLLKKLKD